MANENIQYVKTNVSNNIFKDYWNTSSNKNASYANKKTEEVDLSAYKFSNDSNLNSTSNGIIKIDLGKGVSGKINKEYIDFTKITDNFDDAKNGNFFDSNKVYGEYFDDNLEYEVENDGVVLLKSNGVPMGRTTVRAIRTKIDSINSNNNLNVDKSSNQENKINNLNDDKKNENNIIYKMSDYARYGKYTGDNDSKISDNSILNKSNIESNISGNTTVKIDNTSNNQSNISDGNISDNGITSIKLNGMNYEINSNSNWWYSYKNNSNVNNNYYIANPSNDENRWNEAGSKYRNVTMWKSNGKVFYDHKNITSDGTIQYFNTNGNIIKQVFPSGVIELTLLNDKDVLLPNGDMYTYKSGVLKSINFNDGTLVKFLDDGKTIDKVINSNGVEEKI